MKVEQYSDLLKASYLQQFRKEEIREMYKKICNEGEEGDEIREENMKKGE